MLAYKHIVDYKNQLLVGMKWKIERPFEIGTSIESFEFSNIIRDINRIIPKNRKTTLDKIGLTHY